MHKGNPSISKADIALNMEVRFSDNFSDHKVNLDKKLFEQCLSWITTVYDNKIIGRFH